MNRIDYAFSHNQSSGKKTLIPYLTAGDPEAGWTLALMHALVDAGADIIELGVPFSDPMADGPVIQQAYERALAQGMTLQIVLEIVAEFRKTNHVTPVVLMGYFNSVERMGINNFVNAARLSGVDGVLMVDLPVEESADFQQELVPADIKQIFLVAPTTSVKRMKMISEKAAGFIYYVSMKGVTGSRRAESSEIAENLKQLRALSPLPLGVGFGISDAKTASEMAQLSDAVIIGSALVKAIAGSESVTEACVNAKKFLVPIREALNG